MQLKIGFEISYVCPKPTPMVLCLSAHYSRASDIVVPDYLVTKPSVSVEQYRDVYGNWCSRITAPAGPLQLSARGIVRDTGSKDVIAADACQTPVQDLPTDTLLFLMGSRYCETDRLSETAWQLFGDSPAGWPRVQAICDFVHRHIRFGYEHARATKTALDAYTEKSGVCRDFAHLAVTFCRCMNIPARYCTGYLTDIGVPPPHAPMDFAAWFEAYLDGRWYTFDPRNNTPRVGRVLIAQGRDAADVPISNAFGPAELAGFSVWAEPAA